MIIIDPDRCTGCGACLEVCPTGTLFLVEGKATLDESLCDQCRACVVACPVGAIAFVARQEHALPATRLPAVRSEPEVIPLDRPPAPFRSRAMPVVGAALVWAGREILPRLADLMLDALDRQAARRRMMASVPGMEAQEGSGEGRGRQHRRRQRGGRARG